MPEVAPNISATVSITNENLSAIAQPESIAGEAAGSITTKKCAFSATGLTK